MHTRRVDDRVLEFRHRGWLWFNAYLLYDTETDSLWHHQSGRALTGPLRGKGLPRLPSSVMTFAAWRAEYPDTLVLPKPDDRRPLDVDTYAERNSGISLGVAVELPGAERLYPFHAFGFDRIIQDDVADTPLVLAIHGPSGNAFAYDRRVGGDTLDFVPEPDEGDGPRLREARGTRQWRMRTGRPIRATGARRRLTPAFAYLWEVNAWSLQHPNGDVFGR